MKRSQIYECKTCLCFIIVYLLTGFQIYIYALQTKIATVLLLSFYEFNIGAYICILENESTVNEYYYLYSIKINSNLYSFYSYAMAHAVYCKRTHATKCILFSFTTMVCNRTTLYLVLWILELYFWFNLFNYKHFMVNLNENGNPELYI